MRNITSREEKFANPWGGGGGGVGGEVGGHEKKTNLITVTACGLFISHLIGFLSRHNKHSRNNSSVHGFHSFTVRRHLELVKLDPLVTLAAL